MGLLTHGLQYGTLVMEGIRAYWNDAREQLFLLRSDAHYQRLSRSARIMGLPLPLGTEELVEVTAELLRRNAMRQDVYVRPMLFAAGEDMEIGYRNAPVSLAICVVPFEEGRVPWSRGLRCMTSSWRRVPDVAIPVRAKVSGAYVNSCLAHQEAVEAGFDEAILLTMDGHVSEASAENLLLFTEDACTTPPATDDILEGVTRDGLLQLLRDDIGMPVHQRSIDRSELYTCRELLLCGTWSEVVPVTSVDGRRVGDGMVGHVCRELRRAYLAAARGQSPGRASWIRPVY